MYEVRNFLGILCQEQDERLFRTAVGGGQLAWFKYIFHNHQHNCDSCCITVPSLIWVTREEKNNILCSLCTTNWNIFDYCPLSFSTYIISALHILVLVWLSEGRRLFGMRAVYIVWNICNKVNGNTQAALWINSLQLLVWKLLFLQK